MLFSIVSEQPITMDNSERSELKSVACVYRVDLSYYSEIMNIGLLSHMASSGILSQKCAILNESSAHNDLCNIWKRVTILKKIVIN